MNLGGVKLRSAQWKGSSILSTRQPVLVDLRQRRIWSEAHVEEGVLIDPISAYEQHVTIVLTRQYNSGKWPGELGFSSHCCGCNLSSSRSRSASSILQELSDRVPFPFLLRKQLVTSSERAALLTLTSER